MICSVESCTGCTACKNVCPVNAIDMIQDEYGFYIPKINDQKCIKCKRCEKTCPENRRPQKNAALKTWAAYANDNAIHENSTSGGVASAIANEIIKKGGVVYGHGFNTDNELICSRASTSEKLQNFSGTKYVQSQMKTAIKDIEEDLKNGINVLFIGSPCQVGGLLNSLGKVPNNLLTISFICGGVPSERFLKEHLMKFKIESYSNILFRSGKEYGFWLKKNNQTELIEERWKSDYFIGFDEHLIQRESCYNCQYAQEKRVGDITIGDFWGLHNTRLSSDKVKNGISVVIASSSKGCQVIEECVNNNLLSVEEHDFSECCVENPRLISAVSRKSEVARFRELYKKIGFDKSVNQIYGLKYMVYRTKRTVKKIKIMDAIYHKFFRRK